MGALALALRAELRKALQPPVLALLVVAVATVVGAAIYTQEFASAQEGATRGVSAGPINAGLSCAEMGAATEQQCAEIQTANERLRGELVDDTVLQAGAARSSQTGPGAVGFVAGQFASLLGVAVAFLLAASLTASEWTRRTSALWLPLVDGWARVVAVKAVALFLVLASFFAVSSAALVALTPRLRSAFAIATPADVRADLSSALATVAVAAVVLVLVSVLATIIAVQARAPVATVLGGAAVVAVVAVAQRVGASADIGAVVAWASGAGPTPKGYFSVLWPADSGGVFGPREVAAVLVGAVAVVGAATVATLVHVRRTDAV